MWLVSLKCRDTWIPRQAHTSKTGWRHTGRSQERGKWCSNKPQPDKGGRPAPEEVSVAAWSCQRSQPFPLSSQPTELWDKEPPLSLATQLLTLCFSSRRTQVSSVRLGSNGVYQLWPPGRRIHEPEQRKCLGGAAGGLILAVGGTFLAECLQNTLCLLLNPTVPRPWFVLLVASGLGTGETEGVGTVVNQGRSIKGLGLGSGSWNCPFSSHPILASRKAYLALSGSLCARCLRMWL